MARFRTGGTGVPTPLNAFQSYLAPYRATGPPPPPSPPYTHKMVMRLAFTKNSPLNTTLVDQTSGAVMYEIETERTFFSKTTVIRKPFTSASAVLF